MPGAVGGSGDDTHYPLESPMASVDLLNTTLEEMYARGGILPLITATRKPLIKNLWEKKKVNKESIGGTKFTRPFGYGAPSKGIQIATGNETAALTRKASTKKYEIPSIRHLIPVTIPLLDLRRNDGKQGAVKLIKDYPLATMQQYQEDVEFWMLTGAYNSSVMSVMDTPAFDQYATFNGSVTHSNSDTGWLQGLVPAAQTGVVQGVSRDNAIRHISQYGAITSFASDGMNTLSNVYRACADRAGGMNDGPDFGFADGGTYANLEVAMTDNVRVVNLAENQQNKSTANFLLYKNARVYSCDSNLDPTNAAFSGTPGYSTSAITGGVLYFINSEWMEVAYLEEIEQAPKFVDMIADQDVVVAKMHADMNPIVLRLNAMGRCDGGRIP